jgi:hypothetical protein
MLVVDDPAPSFSSGYRSSALRAALRSFLARETMALFAWNIRDFVLLFGFLRGLSKRAPCAGRFRASRCQKNKRREVAAD